jgi:hypothetical protein
MNVRQKRSTKSVALHLLQQSCSASNELGTAVDKVDSLADEKGYFNTAVASTEVQPEVLPDEPVVLSLAKSIDLERERNDSRRS